MKNKTDILIPCTCGCSILRIGQDADIGYNDVYISQYVSGFGARQESWVRTWKRRLSFVYWILRGKEYNLWEVIINDPKQIAEFKDAVAKLETP